MLKTYNADGTTMGGIASAHRLEPAISGVASAQQLEPAIGGTASAQQLRPIDSPPSYYDVTQEAMPSSSSLSLRPPQEQMPQEERKSQWVDFFNETLSRR